MMTQIPNIQNEKGDILTVHQTTVNKMMSGTTLRKFENLDEIDKFFEKQFNSSMTIK